MQEFISLYNQYRTEIETLLQETLQNNSQLLSSDLDKVRRFFNFLPSLELIYITNNHFQQTSANILKNKLINAAKGKDRTYLMHKMTPLGEHISISAPYVSSATDEACVTLVFEWENQCYFFDFNLTELLTRFGVMERHPIFNQVTKTFYLGVGVSLIFFAVMSIGYAFYDYFLQLMHPTNYGLESVFKPIVALTMGLAIFDLAKTLLEREVFFKAYSDKQDESRLLSKFLTAIIIALSIEALMVVFKTAINDPSQMIHALYLIIGVALIILSLTAYSKWVIRRPKCEIKE